MISIKSGSLISKSHYTSFICLVSAYWKNKEKKRKKKLEKKKKRERKKWGEKKRGGGGGGESPALCTHTYVY